MTSISNETLAKREAFVEALATTDLDSVVEWSKSEDSPVCPQQKLYYSLFCNGYEQREVLVKKLKQANCRHFWIGKSENQYCKHCGIYD